MIRERVEINGIVQGVGFRPFVYRLAKDLNLTGHVGNNSNGVFVEIEGDESQLEKFHNLLQSTLPPLSKIISYHISKINIINDSEFLIKKSDSNSTSTTLISPDIATCKDCLQELFNKNDRRYLYPFINCTNCGPRHTIVKGIPYDRRLTSMSEFPLCPACQKEYEDPSDRRFHAQPNACYECGPNLSIHNGTEEIESTNQIVDVINLLKYGKIIAIKGIGGFHLAVDPANENAINTLRERKGRAEKPFALMAKNIKTIQNYCDVTKTEIELLDSYKRPIVLLKKKEKCELPESIAPNNQYLGFMLAYSPIHHLLLQNEFDSLIMTSANLSEEPIAIDNQEAIERLSKMADYFLMHNRDILQRCDDSIVRVSADKPQILRRSRGYIPYPVFIDNNIRKGILAVGGELKNSIAFSRENSVFLSQYIGDLDNPKAFTFFKHSISHLSNILQIEPKYIAYDMHPEYLSTKWTKEQSLISIPVQHHHAHMVSVMAENNYKDKAIGIILDGTGYGTDGTIWGGEVLVGDANEVERFAWLKPVPMPGGTSAIKEPWRMALSYLYTINGNDIPKNIPFIKSLDSGKIIIISQMIEKNINSPITSSCGRMFDAVSALLNIRLKTTYDAQAAIELEMIASSGEQPIVTPIKPISGIIDSSELIKAIIEMIIQNKRTEDIALYFHYQLAEYLISSTISARELHNLNTVGLSGGVFQNKIFFEYIYKRLQEENFSVLIHTELPPNDGGLALGQVMIANAHLLKIEKEV